MYFNQNTRKLNKIGTLFFNFDVLVQQIVYKECNTIYFINIIIWIQITNNTTCRFIRTLALTFSHFLRFINEIQCHITLIKCKLNCCCSLATSSFFYTTLHHSSCFWSFRGSAWSAWMSSASAERMFQWNVHSQEQLEPSRVKVFAKR